MAGVCILGWIQPFMSGAGLKVAAIVFPTVSLLPNLKQINETCSLKGDTSFIVWQALFVTHCRIWLEFYCAVVNYAY